MLVFSVWPQATAVDKALVNDVHATVNLDNRAPDDDPSTLILVIVVRTPLIHVGHAAVLLGLARRQSAISPAGFLSAIPTWRALVAITVSAVFVSVAVLPALIVVIIEVLVSVLVLLSLVPVICHKPWRAQA